MSYNLDEKDKKIIEVLKDHGDYTTRKIAKKVLLPITTVHNRIKKLKKEKIIKKFTIDLDHSKLDRGLLVYVLISVSLPVLKKLNKSQHEVIKSVKKLHFVEKAHIVSGGTDLVAVVRVKDVKEYNSVLLNKLQVIDGIEKTQSLIVIGGD